MRAQIVHHQVDGVRLRVTNRDLQQVIGKLGSNREFPFSRYRCHGQHRWPEACIEGRRYGGTKSERKHHPYPSSTQVILDNVNIRKELIEM
jgi:hypothetical protein